MKQKTIDYLVVAFITLISFAFTAGVCIFISTTIPIGELTTMHFIAVMICLIVFGSSIAVSITIIKKKFDV